MQNAYQQGIDCDLQTDQQPVNIEMPIIDKIDEAFIQKEKDKAEKLNFWKDSETLASQFAFPEDKLDHKQQSDDLLWDFRHIWTNEEHPEQFKKGINIPPIKIERLPNSHPKRHKLRQISDKKLGYLKQHIEQMLQQGIIEELSTQEAADCYWSPVHIVLEKRFVASKNSVVEKSRCCFDMRQLNLHIPDSCYPLPLQENFRREVARKNYKIFKFHNEV